ncbi:MAG TPA: hypothetical protein VEC16_05620 [Alphaproteobacteria bacterium]|nr:hypothetical protein [Alphaproteobacteria bacterium]
MSFEENIQLYGTKAAVLDYIKNSTPGIPIEPYILIPKGEPWKKYEDKIQSLGSSLVRSSSPIEGLKDKSFAGLLHTTDFYGDSSVEEVMNSVNSDVIKKYMQIHDLSSPVEMIPFFQKKSQSDWNMGMMRHPHRDNLIFISGKQAYRNKNVLYDEDSKKFYDANNYFSSLYTREESEELPEKQIQQALEYYKHIESLEKFQTGYVYNMEFGTDPLSIYQFTSFKPKQKANWENKKESYSEYPKEKLSTKKLVFGITNPEGLELKVITKNYYDRVFEQNEKAIKEETCINEQDEERPFGLGTSTTTNIDLVFPNAKAWLTYPRAGGFLAHEMFRPLQHYDISILNYMGEPKNIKIFSDGITATIIDLSE